MTHTHAGRHTGTLPLRTNMSIDGTRILFEGFLRKRKDTIKLRWVTYWFRLQNTTLFFYTKKNGSASHLRGYYYIYTVQSVREVQRADSKPFMFEIIMTNGKRKMLAAETAALRQEWVGHLWQAMHLSTSGVSDSKSTHVEGSEQGERINSSAATCSHSDGVMESPPARPFSAPARPFSAPARPLSAPAPPGHIHPEIRSVACLVRLPGELDSEEPTYRNTLPACNCQNHTGDRFSGLQGPGGPGGAEGRQEGDYDILPLRKRIREINASAETDNAVYDFPLSYRRTAEHPVPTESIYDVPSSILRKMSDHTLEESLEDEIYWRV